MFNNIGGKIKVVAKVSCYVGMAFSILGCLGNILTAVDNLYFSSAIYWLLGLIFLPVLSWVGSLLIYGFGQLIENSDTLIDLMTYDEDGEE